MRHSASLACFALATALAWPDTAALGQDIAYRLPAPATATYVMVDTTTASLNAPTGRMDVSGNSSLTYAVSFESDGDRLMVSAHLTAFTAQMQEPMETPESISQSAAGVGDLVLVLGGDGLVEVISGMRRSYRDLALLVEPHEVIFPRLPPGDVQPGDSWSDTVTVSGGGEFERVVAYTYTLVGDTTVDGRSQLRIDVSGDTRLTVIDDGSPTVLTGADTGFILWDSERGLPSWSEVSRSYAGTVEMPDGSMAVEFNATTRLRLGN